MQQGGHPKQTVSQKSTYKWRPNFIIPRPVIDPWQIGFITPTLTSFTNPSDIVELYNQYDKVLFCQPVAIKKVVDTGGSSPHHSGPFIKGSGQEGLTIIPCTINSNGKMKGNLSFSAIWSHYEDEIAGSYTEGVDYYQDPLYLVINNLGLYCRIGNALFQSFGNLYSSHLPSAYNKYYSCVESMSIDFRAVAGKFQLYRGNRQLKMFNISDPDASDLCANILSSSFPVYDEVLPQLSAVSSPSFRWKIDYAYTFHQYPFTHWETNSAVSTTKPSINVSFGIQIGGGYNGGFISANNEYGSTDPIGRGSTSLDLSKLDKWTNPSAVSGDLPMGQTTIDDGHPLTQSETFEGGYYGTIPDRLTCIIKQTPSGGINLYHTSTRQLLAEYTSVNQFLNDWRRPSTWNGVVSLFRFKTYGTEGKRTVIIH